MDVGLVTESYKTCIIDGNKLQRGRGRCSNKIRKKQQNFRLINVVYVSARKDANQTVVQGANNKHYRSVQLKHYTVVGELETYHLTHFSLSRWQS